MTSTTSVPSWAVAGDAMLGSELSDTEKTLPVADEEEEPPPDEIPPIPNFFKDSVSATKWADMTVVARAVHIETASRSERNIQRQEARKSLVRQQEMENKEIAARIAAATTAAAHATQQASAAVHHRNDLRRQYEAAELAASEAADAIAACDAELAAEERRADALLAKRRRTESQRPPIPRQHSASPHLRSASRESSPPPSELDQAPSSGSAVSVHSPERGAYVYDNDRQEGDSAFLGVRITLIASYSQYAFKLDDMREVMAAAAVLLWMTEEYPCATLRDVLGHAVAHPDFPSISVDGRRLLVALRSAYRSSVCEVRWPRPPRLTTALVGEDGGGHNARAEGMRFSALHHALGQELSSRRDGDRTGGSGSIRRDSNRTGSIRHADRRDGRQSRQTSGNKSRRNGRGGKGNQASRGRRAGGRGRNKKSASETNDMRNSQ